jgi:tripartite-type tricarboxylate transporter receptor subunit TctC
MLTRRAVIAALAAGSALTGRALADSFPARPITLMVPFAPGGSSDQAARSIQADLQERLGWTVVVEYRPGAATVIGSGHVARAQPDGHTLLLAPAPFIITQFAEPKPPYDALTDFAPISLLVTSPLVLAVGPKRRVKTLGDLIAQAKAAPEQLSYGTPGYMSLPHLATLRLAQLAGISLNHVPYRGGSLALTDLVVGTIDMFLTTPESVISYAESGQLTLLAVTAPERLEVLPQVPTMQEAGIQGYEPQAWFGLAAPAGTPSEIVALLAKEIATTMKSPALRGRLAKLGMVPAPSTPDSFAAFLKAEHDRWRATVALAKP